MLITTVSPGHHQQAVRMPMQEPTTQLHSTNTGMQITTAALIFKAECAAAQPTPNLASNSPVVCQYTQSSQTERTHACNPGNVSGVGCLPVDMDSGEVAKWVSNASFATLTLIYSFTQLLDLASQMSTLVGVTLRVGQLLQVGPATPLPAVCQYLATGRLSCSRLRQHL